MSFLYKKNFGYGELNVELSDVGTSMIMKPGHNFSTDVSKNFKLLVWDKITYPEPSDDPNKEIITATYSGTLNTYTVSRGEEGTSGVVHAIGSACFMTITAAVLSEFEIQTPPYVAGDYLIAGPDIFKNVYAPGTSYVKISEIYIPRSGTLRIKFYLGWNGTGNPNVQARIYRNGVAVGIARDTGSSSIIEYSEDIAGWATGDLCQLYVKNDSGGDLNVGGMRLYELLPTREIPTTQGPLRWWGTGVPNSVLGSVGDVYHRTDGGATTSIYIKTGSSTWTAK